MAAEPRLGDTFRNGCALSEVFELLSVELQRRADLNVNLKELAFQAWQDAVVVNLPKGRQTVASLDPHRVWLLSSGSIADLPVGSRIPLNNSHQTLRVEGTRGARLLGLNLNLEAIAKNEQLIEDASYPVLEEVPQASGNGSSGVQATSSILYPADEIPYAPDSPPDAPPDPYAARPKYPFVRGRGAIDAPMACFQMLSQHFGVPFRRDLIRKVLQNQLKTTETISLQACGAIAEMMGMRAQLIQVPATAINRLKAPALIRYLDSFAILYSITEKELVLAIPEQGIRRKKPADFAEAWGKEGQVLLLQPALNKFQEKFSLRWFLPSIYRYRKVLIEVLVASLFVQLLV